MDNVKTGRVEHWAHRLSGLPAEDLRDRRQRIRSWNIEPLTRELVDVESVDNLLACHMLVSALELLIERGVPLNKLQSKLRNDPDVWPTWAEIVGASSVAKFYGPEVDVTLEAGKSRGRHPDLRLSLPASSVGTSVEFKALGLSDFEVGFFRQCAPLLKRFCPKLGVATAHVDIDDELDLASRLPNHRERRDRDKQLRREQKHLPKEARGLTAAVFVGHAAEQRYLERLRDRLQEATAQLPATDDCWVAFWWSNGAPAHVVADVLETLDLPSHVVGIILVGAAIIVPNRNIHYYTTFMKRVAKNQEGVFVSLEDNPVGKLVLEVLQRSPHPRPTLVVDPDIRGQPPVLKRVGERRILPFNLLLAADPPQMRREDPPEMHSVPSDHLQLGGT